MAVLLLMKFQLALNAKLVLKKDISKALSEYGLNAEEAIENLTKKGYLLSSGYKQSYVMLTTKGRNTKV
jgi:hypothetical protein